MSRSQLLCSHASYNIVCPQEGTFCGTDNLIHRVCHKADGTALEPLVLDFTFDAPKAAARANSTTVVVKAQIHVVLFYHPCDSGIETMPEKADYEPTLQANPGSLRSR